ncbi:hypothetical protein LCGC14_1997140 [marine sediment metagenome]|uniref:Uncharacterized protein n=1 Tax=marine sediment metagenome TaxID=412755 RepID=A0A0F9FSA1_9ZZZZ
MPAEGEIQVANVHVGGLTSTGGAAFPFEAGARGEAVRLLAVHYSYQPFPANGSYLIFAGLSSNPETSTAPPASFLAFLADKAIYGASAYSINEVVGAAGVWQVRTSTQVIPLYGIIRPRRQLVVVHMTIGGIFEIKAEIYYQPVALGKTDLDALNLKYGKYRRTA